jgi:hypothetical protein
LAKYFLDLVFGDLGSSFFTLFQVDDTGELVRWNRKTCDGSKFPYSWIFFVTFIMIATFGGR